MQRVKSVLKHRTRKVDEIDDRKIRKLQQLEGLKTYLEAKQLYFNKLDAGEVMAGVDDIDMAMGSAEKEFKQDQEKKQKRIKRTINQIADGVSLEDLKKKQKKSLTIAETKLGVTLVLSKDDCIKLGWDINQTFTGIVIKDVRAKLSLPEKQVRT